MRIACLQFAPEVGKVQENIAKANGILENASLDDIDILCLPELALTGAMILILSEAATR